MSEIKKAKSSKARKSSISSRKNASEKRRKKTKKCKSSSVCCQKCINFNHGTCSLDGSVVENTDVCKSFSDQTTEQCQRCRRKVSYKNRDEYYNAIIHFSMESDSGTSSAQNIHLCRKCETEAFVLFQEFLEKVKEYTHSTESANT